MRLNTLKMQCSDQLSFLTRQDHAEGGVSDLFFMTAEMKKSYRLYHDVVFINRKLIRTRFGRSVILFCGVDNKGRTLVFGVALVKEDTTDCFRFAVDSFMGEVMVVPQILIIERVSQMKNAIECLIRENPRCSNLTMLYCFQQLHRSLKFQIKQILHQRENYLSEKVKNLMIRVEKLPKIEGYA